MTDMQGNVISGYRFGSYHFPVRRGRISALGTTKYDTEGELLRAYDSQFPRIGGPVLLRKYADGSEYQLRGEAVRVEVVDKES